MSESAPRPASGDSGAVAKATIVAFAAPLVAAVLALAVPGLAAWARGFGAAVLALAGLVPAFMYARMTREAGAFSRDLHELALGDVARAVRETPDDARSPLAAQIETLRRVLAERTQTIETSAQTQDQSLTEARADVEQLRGAIDKQSASIDETSSSLQEMTISLRSLAEHVDILASASEEASSSVLQMSATNDEVAASMTTLSDSAQESASSIEEMTRSIKEVARNVEDLSSTAEETSSSMNEMDISIHQVETNANETARLSEEVTRAAELGVDAINQTIEGINRIKHSSGQAVGVIEVLGHKIGEISKIVEVIDDNSDINFGKTNTYKIVIPTTRATNPRIQPVTSI